jgi:hypothetical protein
MADEGKRCGHDGCLCATTGDSEYCSPYCEDAADQNLTEIRCDCGHPGCSA